MRSDHALKLVVLGRDGTLNACRDDYVKSPEEWEPLPGAMEALARLHHEGWHVVVATNQGELGRGLFDMHALNAIHVKLQAQLVREGGRIDAFFFCPHAPDEDCECRKPQPGLIQLISQRYGVAPAHIPVVGDSLRDLQAAAAAGAQPHLVRTGDAGALTDQALAHWTAQVPGTVVHTDLAAFVDHLFLKTSSPAALREDSKY